jgi:hypothetical protein
MAVDLENYAYSFQHAIITLEGTQFTGISSITFSQTIERGVVYGTLAKPLKRARGQVQLGEGTITFSDLKEAMQFYSALGDEPSAALFTADVTLANSNGDVDSFELQSCTLSSFAANFESGSDALGLELPFNFMHMKINGKDFVK